MNRQEILDKIEELKKKKKEAEEMANLQDAFQHSFKIFLNSVYGFTGTKYSPVFNKDLAESVTLTGQNVIKEMVQFTNKCLNKIGGTSEDTGWVVAGDTDSVAGDTKIFLNGPNVPIEEAFKKVANAGQVDRLENGTEVAVPTVDTFITRSLNGLDILRNISRHKVSKEMWTITIPNKKPLKMTEDHSVIVYRDGELIECKPKDIRKTDKLVTL